MGPDGLVLNSKYDETPEKSQTSETSRTKRREINATIEATWNSTDVDADGIRTRWELEAAIDHAAFFTGDGFAIRVGKKSDEWRLVSRDRVANPNKIQNNKEWRDGFRIGSGKVDAINILPPTYLTSGSNYGPDSKTDTLVKWNNPDGTPNVIHKVGIRLPGMLRGVTELAPIIIMQRQVGGVLESHVAAKRLQAIMAMIQEAEDPKAYEDACKDGTALSPEALMNIQGPLNMWIIPPGTKTLFTDTKFNGADLEAFLTICYKVQCATQQMPVDVVLNQMGEASLSSSRAGLDQFDRTCQTKSKYHIASVTSKIDRVAISSKRVFGGLKIESDDYSKIMSGKYSRPPRYSTDRLKDANTVKTLKEAGVSETTAYESIGICWEDEQETKRSEREFLNAQGLPVPSETPSDGSSDMSNKAQDAESETVPPEDQEPEMAGDTMEGSQDISYNRGATGRAG
jgi:capsid protein